MINPAVSVWHKIERRLARICECQIVELKYDTGIICFSFDDVPKSACLQGNTILEKYGLKGTYYICGGLTETGEYHTKSDLLRLVDVGHELGCHGYGHRSYQSISEAEMLADIQRNRYFFEEIGCDLPRHFAYPYGHVSPSVKRVVAREFSSARGVQPGINYPNIDLALLKSFPLYQRLWNENSIVEVIEKNARLGGLLIFFTHGVSPNPNEFDCSIELLDFAIQTSMASANKVLPVGEALLNGGVDTKLKCVERAANLESFRT
jgi:peptidoglycan/xylan/chitin deacetylase (PgdA/CDA1 family)